MASNPENKNYFAFISYANSELDTELAIWLQKAIENFALPKSLFARTSRGKWLGKVFRDASDLPVTQDLSMEIRKALNASQNLIIVCSPKTVDRPWVNAEVADFIAQGKASRIFTAIIDGEPGAVLPTALKKASDVPLETQGRNANWPVMQLAADFRPRASIARSQTRKTGLLRLLAGMLAIDLDDLTNRIEQREKRQRLIGGSIGAAALMTVTLLAGYAELNRREANTRRVEAQRNLAGAMTALSAKTVESDPTEALRLALAAWPSRQGDAKDMTEDSFKAISSAVSRQREVVRLGTTPSVDPAWSPDGRYLVTASTQGVAIFDRRDNSSQRAAIDGLTGLLGEITWSPDSQRFAIASEGGGFVVDVGNASVVARLTTAGRRMAWSPDGSLIAASNRNGSIELWGSADFTIFDRINNHTKEILSMAWSSSSRYLASASDDPGVVVWSKERKVVSATLKQPRRVRKVLWSPTADVLAIGTFARIDLFDANSSGPMTSLVSSQADVQELSYSRDGKLLAAGASDGMLRIWSMTNFTLTYSRNHPVWISAIDWSHNGRNLAYCAGDYICRILTTDTYQELITLAGHTSFISKVRWAPDDDMIATNSNDRTTRVWSSELGVKSESFGKPSSSPIMQVAWDQSRNEVYTVTAGGMVRVWGSKEGRYIYTADLQQNITNADFNLAAMKMFFRNSAGLNQVWDIVRREVLWSWQGVPANEIPSVEWVCQGSALMVNAQKTIELQDPSTGKEIRRLVLPESSAFGLAWSPDCGEIAISTRGDSAFIWRTNTDLPQRLGPDPQLRETNIKWTNDGARIVFHRSFEGSKERTISVWDSNGIKVATGNVQFPYHIETDTQSSRLAVIGTSGIVLYNMYGLVQTTNSNFDVTRNPTWQPSGDRIAAVNDAGETVILDERTGLVIAALNTKDDKVAFVVWSKDGSKLLTSGKDGVTRIWDLRQLPSGNIFEVACRSLGSGPIKWLACLSPF